MSEQDEQRPLTRRERRLREMAETGALDLSEISEVMAEPKPASQPKTDGEIEISPFNDDGTPRSRREMRELREQALAERADAEPAAEAEAAELAEPVVDSADADEAETAPEATAAEDVAADEAPADESPAEEAPAEQGLAGETPAEPEAEPTPEPIPAVRPKPAESRASEAEAAAPEAADEATGSEQLGQDPAPADQTGALDFDTLIAPPTEPFTVAELQEAEAAAADDLDDEDEPEAVSPAEAAPTEKPKRRFPWQRKAAADDAAAADAPAPEVSDEDAPAEQPPADAVEADPAAGTEDERSAPDAPAADLAAELSPGDERDPAADPVVVEDVVAVEETVAIAEITEPETAAEPDEPNPEQKTSYSFPDIAPPEEWRSVFDDPASREVPDQGGQGGDFDDLISRAVAQEGTSTTAGTSALILPSMPEDTGGLTGPIGTTGELYVTGSLKLPKSLGETGGHSALHDSIEIDPITGEESADVRMTGEGPAPVSARHAVSARAASGLPVVKPVTDRSKLPLVLSLTGGGLLIVVVALGVWGASNGMFG